MCVFMVTLIDLYSINLTDRFTALTIYTTTCTRSVHSAHTHTHIHRDTFLFIYLLLLFIVINERLSNAI